MNVFVVKYAATNQAQDGVQRSGQIQNENDVFPTEFRRNELRLQSEEFGQ